MSIQLTVDNVNIPLKQIRFSDGSSNIKLDIPEDFKPSSYFSISVNNTTPADNYLWEILLVLDAAEAHFGAINKRILNLSYLPHARADRRFQIGNSHPLDVFICSVMIFFDEIHLTDPHSEFYQSIEYLNFIVKFQHDCFIEVVRDIKSDCVLVSPDKGALNKIYKLQDALAIRGVRTSVIEAEKKRDLETGRIIETTLPDVDLCGKIIYIIDDLLDGGGTFIPLSDKLRSAGAKEINLYVTHGVFAKGLNILKGKIDKLHVYQTIGTYVTAGDILNFNLDKEVK